MGNPIFFENSDYAAEFLQYLAQHPDEADRIPEGAVVIFLPEQRDPGLAAHNRFVAQSAEAYRQQGHDVVQSEEWALAMRQQPLTSWQARGRL